MDFGLIKRRTSDLFSSIPQSLPTINRKPFTVKGTWEKMQLPAVPRSSHSIDVVGGSAYLFGGEVNPCEPVENDVHTVNLPTSGAPADYYTIKARAEERPERPEPAKPDDVTSPETVASTIEGQSVATPELGVVPPPRVGHASAVIGHRILIFGGRGGPDMSPLQEGGRVWVFDTRSHTWSYLDPASPAANMAAVAPEARSYHAAVAIDKPNDFDQVPHRAAVKPRSRAQSVKRWVRGDVDERGTPQRPIIGAVAEKATDQDADGYGTLIVHGGCLASGTRTADVWAFDVRSHVWQRLPDAPGKPRGGTALAVSRSRLYRFGGFNGESEEGGQLDYIELGVDKFDDESSAGEVVVTSRGGWQSFLHGKQDVGYKEADAADVPLKETEPWPGHRSVAALEPVTVGGGREYLVLALGEKEPSSTGHSTAGTFWDDVWAFQVPSQAWTAAKVSDTVLSAVGRQSGEGKWFKVEMGPHDGEDDASLRGPGPRGWFATARLGDAEESGLIIWGGVDAANRRLGDGWILRLT